MEDRSIDQEANNLAKQIEIGSTRRGSEQEYDSKQKRDQANTTDGASRDRSRERINALRGSTGCRLRQRMISERVPSRNPREGERGREEEEEEPRVGRFIPPFSIYDFYGWDGGDQVTCPDIY